MQCNPRNKRGHQDLLPIIFYHFVIKINWYMYFIVYEIHVSMYLYFVLLYDYINLNLIVTDFGTWIRVEDACWYFTLIWPTLAICAWMPCDCKACTATSAAEGDSKSTNPYPANIQKKKCLQMQYVWYSKPNINLQRERVLSYKRFTRYWCTKCNNIFQQLDKCC